VHADGGQHGGGSVSGAVQVPGAPPGTLGGVVVNATPTAGPPKEGKSATAPPTAAQQTACTATDPSGMFQLTGLAPGQYRITATAVAYGKAPVPFPTLSVVPGLLEVSAGVNHSGLNLVLNGLTTTIMLPPVPGNATATLRVRDGSGPPLPPPVPVGPGTGAFHSGPPPTASFAASRTPGALHRGGAPGPGTPTTGPPGTAKPGGVAPGPKATTTTIAAPPQDLQFQGVPPGDYTLTIQQPGTPSQAVEVTVGGNGPSPIPPLASAIPPGNGMISGFVTNGYAPVVGATLQITDGSRPPNQFQAVNTLVTDSQGAFSVLELPTPATYQITVSSANNATMLTSQALAQDQQVTGLQITLKAQLFTVDIRLTAAPGVAGPVTVLISNGINSATQTVVPGMRGASGFDISIPGLPAVGQYTATITGAGIITTVVPIDYSQAFIAGVPIGLVTIGGASGITLIAAPPPTTTTTTAPATTTTTAATTTTVKH
jgi:hypothetical protein